MWRPTDGNQGQDMCLWLRWANAPGCLKYSPAAFPSGGPLVPLFSRSLLGWFFSKGALGRDSSTEETFRRSTGCSFKQTILAFSAFICCRCHMWAQWILCRGSTCGLRVDTPHYTEPGCTLHPPLAGIKGDAKSGVTLSATPQPLVMSHA